LRTPRPVRSRRREPPRARWTSSIVTRDTSFETMPWHGAVAPAPVPPWGERGRGHRPQPPPRGAGLEPWYAGGQGVHKLRDSPDELLDARSDRLYPRPGPPLAEEPCP